MEEIKRLREMMKSYTAADEDFDSDMNHDIKKPSLAKYHKGSKRIHLPKNFEKILQNNNFYQFLQRENPVENIAMILSHYKNYLTYSILRKELRKL